MYESQALNDFIFDHCNKSMENAISAKRHPLWKRSCPELNDMNRTVLLIPALCGTLTDSTVTPSLRRVSLADIEAWEKEYIPYTVRKKRHAFFNGSDSQNAGKSNAA